MLHLQNVVIGLEREMREFRRKEKEYKKLAKIQGIGVVQKHNTQADKLKIRIKVLEELIQKKSPEIFRDFFYISDLLNIFCNTNDNPIVSKAPIKFNHK